MIQPKIAGYEFAEGSRFQTGAEKNAKAVGDHLEMLRKQFKGELTAEDVLEDAKNDNSPLHSFFEWSDTEAARQYRLQQARGLIRSVVAIYTQPEKPPVRTKAFVHINEPSAPHYREAIHALSLTKTRDMVMKQALSELISWKKRYKDLQEFAAMVRVIDAFERELEERTAG